jgi:hypothetical protein
VKPEWVSSPLKINVLHCFLGVSEWVERALSS